MAKGNPTYEDLGKDTPAKRKFVAKIKNTYPELDEKETTSLLRDTKRFVNLVRKLRTEPQLQVSYKRGKNDAEVQKIVDTDIEELAKVVDKPMPFGEAIEKLKPYLPKQHGTRRKKI